MKVALSFGAEKNCVSTLREVVPTKEKETTLAAPAGTLCPICGSEMTRPLYCALHWQACLGCGVWFREPMPTEHQLSAFYMDAFYNGGNGTATCMHATDISCGRQYLDLIAKELGLQWRCLRVLDYGAGEGDLSILLQRMGADVLALDPYGYNACDSRRISAVRSLQEIPAGKKFDGIVMTEVVEHLVDPVSLLRQLSSRLREDGWIFLTTPNNEGLKARLLRDGWRESLNDSHLFLFSWGSLARALRLAGFAPSLCRGFVRFSANPLRTAVQYSLQALRMQGNIWAIGRKH